MSPKFNYRYQLYKHLQANTQAIYAESRKAAEDLGLLPEFRGALGLTGAVSGCHGLLSRAVEEAVNEVSRKVLPSAVLDEQLRDLVKSYYGDEYDAALVNTCEAALNTAFDVLCMPPTLGRGEPYRTRYMALYERHLHHQGAYGRPFPPKYKEINAERGEAAGEYGVQGKRAFNLDTLVVKPVGATYECHGIKFNPIPNMLHVDAAATIERVAEACARQPELMAGIASLGYDTPGYGYGQKDANGAPLLQVGLAEIANRYDIPYIVDNAWGVPFIGTDIRKTGAHVMMYSMDKASGAPTCGLIIGKEEEMVLMRRALGIHGARYGTLSSHGKASHVGFDPGKEALAGAIAAMRILKDQPEITLKALDDLYTIVMEEFESLPTPLRQGWVIYKSVNCQSVELNYYDSWANGAWGLPVFSIEDMYAGSHLLQNAMSQMGMIPTIAYDANIMISNGVGNLDEEGRLLERPTRLAVRGMFKIMEILGRYAGMLD
ncbi:MAG TPA: hypothetical protein PKH92_01445 [Anaerolineaceae bacterium]|jgi:hypothetical protein|nr:hypothetical protein [Longilinea sp.]HNR45965.1 hypothetical protein [Anaerolineaceae bacterium]HOD03683.1 hypothetical protein [Anaerolineaceae bacterium]